MHAEKQRGIFRVITNSQLKGQGWNAHNKNSVYNVKKVIAFKDKVLANNFATLPYVTKTITQEYPSKN